ncbi:restriction endonuclease subunit S [Pseudomonas aeruginosa]|uniref:restriction endonuclease subunit S n=1 Tax=Pseudomonas aeruginosa TaxID=287 RepID=UPI000F869C72|nr:restriction endonuclease subunit S [Pseudomonas aeruginosa]ELS1858913.1 restriction endonuclease subunit S [Pseudomonas aeruginosa]MCQ9820456.1 restriction endonuclease subunit S [Pseudomonas aeruginosa]RUA40374.1 restriction endonuclease subunit S [Pseudomonas aeruginosa]
MSWPVVKLSDVATINPRPPRDVDESQQVTFVAMASASEDGYLLSSEARILSETKKGFTYFDRNDVLLAKITPCFENGKCLRPGQIPTEIGFGSTEFHVIRPDTERLDGLYLFYLVWNEQFRFLGEKSMSGAAGQKRVGSDFLKGFEIPLPPLPEQKRIAAILDKADAIRRKRQQAIQLADDFLRAVFLDMFGDPVTNPKGWPKKSLKLLGKSATGRTPPSEKADMWGEGLPFVTPGDLSGRVDSSVREVTQEGAEHSKVCRTGSLLVCCIGATIGKVGIAGCPAAFNQQINAQEWGAEILDIYGYFVFKLFPDLVRERAIQTTLPILKKSLFDEIEIPVPAKGIQEKFALLAQKISSFSARHESGAEMPIFESLSQMAFSGQL